jgi:hypothetical protein
MTASFLPALDPADQGLAGREAIPTFTTNDRLGGL